LYIPIWEYVKPVRLKADATYIRWGRRRWDAPPATDHSALIVGLDRDAQHQRSDPLAGVVRAVEKGLGEVGVAEHAVLVEGVAEGHRALVVPGVVHALDVGDGRSAERELQRAPLEAAARPIVGAALQRPERADQPHVAVQVVEDQRDRLLA